MFGTPPPRVKSSRVFWKTIEDFWVYRGTQYDLTYWPWPGILLGWPVIAQIITGFLENHRKLRGRGLGLNCLWFSPENPINLIKRQKTHQTTSRRFSCTAPQWKCWPISAEATEKAKLHPWSHNASLWSFAALSEQGFFNFFWWYSLVLWSLDENTLKSPKKHWKT